MKMRKTALLVAVILIITLVFVSCKESGNANNSSADVGSTKEPSKASSMEKEPREVSSKIEKPASVESDEETEKTEADAAKKIKMYRVENIVFNYTDDLVVKEIEGLPYFYYNDTSFFYANSVVMELDGGEIDEAFAAGYFAEATEGFSQEPWQNGELVNPPQVIQFNGINIWIGEISTVTEGIAFTSSTALLYNGGRLTNLTLITDDVSYPTSMGEFADTIYSIMAVE